MVEIKFLEIDDWEILEKVADGVFDDPIDPVATRRFISDPRHHLAAAVDGGVLVGFVSAVHYDHPDKAYPELWINEVTVAPSHRRRGIGKALMDATLQRGRALGCTEAWVLTDRSNTAALRLYAASGGQKPSEQLMVTVSLQ